MEATPYMALVLTRRFGESTRIGDAIVTIHPARLDRRGRVSKNAVRVIIEAPPHVQIVRDEAKDKEVP